jgi:molecular chaperone GrpE
MKSKKRAHDEERDEGAVDRVDSAPSDPADLESLEGESEAQLIDEMTQRIAELDNRYKRALADYQNSQRRAIENERRARQDGMASVVESLVPVMDHFKLALAMDPAQASPEQIFGGVKVILDELTRTLAGYGVAPIEPAPNDEFDPMRHQAMMMVDSDDVEPGRVVMLLQAGYALGERVIRPAKVSVRPGEERGDEGNENGAPGDEPGAQE